MTAAVGRVDGIAFRLINDIKWGGPTQNSYKNKRKINKKSTLWSF